MVLQCIPCGRSVSFRDVPVPAPNCKHCGAREWRHVDHPKKPYAITANDRRFLKSLRISADDAPVDEPDDDMA